MQLIGLVVGLGVLFALLDGAVSKPNPDGCMKLVYLIVGGLLVLGLALIALALFTYPLWSVKLQ